MSDKIDIGEFPSDYKGRRTYVPVVGMSELVASCYVYRGGDGRYHLHPEYGGTWDGLAARSNTVRMPYVMRDIGAYQSPIDGTYISSRSEHRNHLKTHDVLEVGNEPIGRMQRPDYAPKPREIGEGVKRRLEEVRAMPQRQYDEQVQQHFHEVKQIQTEVQANGD
jgi:hypothetical protein